MSVVKKPIPHISLKDPQHYRYPLGKYTCVGVNAAGRVCYGDGGTPEAAYRIWREDCTRSLQVQFAFGRTIPGDLV